MTVWAHLKLKKILKDVAMNHSFYDFVENALFEKRIKHHGFENTTLLNENYFLLPLRNNVPLIA